MIKLYICCLVLINGSVEVGLDIDMKFHQEVMEIVSYDNKKNKLDFVMWERQILSAATSHPSAAMKQAIMQSLKGQALAVTTALPLILLGKSCYKL